MNRIAAIALFVAATFITAGNAMAQKHVVTATIPFAFAVNGSSLPAGDYIISSESDSAKLLEFSGRNKNVHILALGTSSGEGNSPMLVFHKYGAKFFLSEIRYTDSSMNVRFPASKMEKRARRHAEEASLPIIKEVMIAFN